MDSELDSIESGFDSNWTLDWILDWTLDWILDTGRALGARSDVAHAAPQQRHTPQLRGAARKYIFYMRSSLAAAAWLVPSAGRFYV